MQLVPRTFDCPKPPVLLCLCNPITGECHFLPPLETPHSPPPLGLDYPDVGLQVTMNAIITAADNSNLGRGQLLLITTKGSGPDSKVYLHSYSMGTRSWSTPTRWLEGWCVIGTLLFTVAQHTGCAWIAKLWRAHTRMMRTCTNSVWRWARRVFP